MQISIHEKLDLMDALYPPERLARSKERWTRLWRGEPPLDRYPFVYAPIAASYYGAGQTPEERVHEMLDEIIARGQAQDDFIPGFSPGCRQATIPNMFGAEEIILGEDYACDRRIFTPEDIDCLPEPAITPGSITHAWLEMQRYALEVTEGRLAILVTDMQGPADVCGQLWGYDAFLASAYEDPDRYHALMGRATDAFMLFWSRQQEVAGEMFVGTHLWSWNWAPPEAGASLSADSLVMISPTFYEEFYQPYLQQIGERFGGLSVHSCGDFSAVIPALCATPTVRAINAGQMTVTELLDAGVREPTLIIAGTATDALTETLATLNARNVRAELTLWGLWPIANGVIKPPADWTPEDRATMRQIDEQVQQVVKETV